MRAVVYAPRTMQLLITGGTGFLGRHIVRSVLERGSDTHVHLIVRPRRDETARQRVDRILSGVTGLQERVHVLEGRLEQPFLGLDQAQYDRLASTVDRILHGAANVRFDQDIEGARQANVDVTRRMLEFARAADVGRLDHISTCFVAGHRTDRVLEQDLTHDAGFKNTY